jgi:predicted RNA binding protein YcfA (HicA-like mRNA interferase family)
LPRFPGVNHEQAVKAFKKAGFRVLRQGRHVSMAKDDRIIVIPRHNPVHAFTMAGIVRDAGLSQEEFKELLK